MCFKREISSNTFCLVHECLFQNQIYIPPKDQSTCCGVCKNISCLHKHENGTTMLYKVSHAPKCFAFEALERQIIRQSDK